MAGLGGPFRVLCYFTWQSAISRVSYLLQLLLNVLRPRPALNAIHTLNATFHSRVIANSPAPAQSPVKLAGVSHGDLLNARKGKACTIADFSALTLAEDLQAKKWIGITITVRFNLLTYFCIFDSCWKTATRYLGKLPSP